MRVPSYNLIYPGRIVSIGPKTVVVDDRGERRRLSLYDFVFYNWDFNSAAVLAQNAHEVDLL